MRLAATSGFTCTCLCALLLVLLAPTPAVAAGSGDAATTFVRVPVTMSGVGGWKRGGATPPLPHPVDLIGASWTGAAISIDVRTASSAAGEFGPWHRLAAERTEGPDAGSFEARLVDRRRVASAPLWAPGTVRVQVRGVGRGLPADLELLLVASSSTGGERRRLASSPADRAASAQLVHRVSTAPPVTPRTAWGARPAAAPPWYSDSLLAMVVHHTDTGNTYRCSDVPAILRGIQRYHMDANGWNDIGYNFLVDRCGRVWEGRGGGIDQPVGGAHTLGFNTSTSGIALIGVHSGAAPSRAARLALLQTISWRMDVAHRSPALRSSLAAAASSNAHDEGDRVFVRAVSGHRDLFSTACPGSRAYRSINAWRATAWRIGGPKVANVTAAVRVDPATGTVAGGHVKAVANGRSDRWLVTLRTTDTGAIVRTLRRRPGILDLDLPAMPAAPPAATLTLEIVALRGPRHRSRPWSARAAAYGPDPGFALTTEPPASVSPNGDLAGDTIDVGFVLPSRRRLTADLVDPATGTVMATLESSILAGSPAERRRAYVVPETVPDGAYTLRIGLAFDEPGRSWEERALTVDRRS